MSAKYPKKPLTWEQQDQIKEYYPDLFPTLITQVLEYIAELANQD